MKIATVCLFGRVSALALVGATALGAQDSARANARSEIVARYRNRLLGVFDEQSGEPIDGLEVMDVLSGLTALTTRTGTVSLAFLPDGGSLLRLRKVGYTPLTMNVAISPADTNPVTIVMRRAAQELPAVVTKDSARRHISPALQGFDERMRANMGGQSMRASSSTPARKRIPSGSARRTTTAVFSCSGRANGSALPGHGFGEDTRTIRSLTIRTT